ncbi:MAG: hypothetical protein QW303_03925 [Nitrososphaerota archaeon]
MNVSMNISDMNDLFEIVNLEVYGFFGLGILLMIYMLLFTHFSNIYRYTESAFLSSVVCFPMVVIMNLINIMETEMIFLYIIFVSTLAMIMFIMRRRE